MMSNSAPTAPTAHGTSIFGRWACLGLLGFGAVLCGCVQSRPAGVVQFRPAILTADAVQEADWAGSAIAPRNGNAAWVLRVTGSGASSVAAVRVGALSGGSPNLPPDVSVDDVLPMVVDLDRADYVRLTGGSTGVHSLPRVLLPLERRSEAFIVPRRNPAPGASRLFWVDMHVAAGTPPGQYGFNCSLLDATGVEVARASLRLEVIARELPATPRLTWAASVEALGTVFPGTFDAVPTRLLNRTDPASAPAVAVLDALQRAARQNQVTLLIPSLSPTVKWSADGTPRIDWSDYDTLVGPWLSGAGFSDGVGLSLWTLPAVGGSAHLDSAARGRVDAQVREHFRDRGWLDRCATAPEPTTNPSGDEDRPAKFSWTRGLLAEAALTPRPGCWLDARGGSGLSDQDELQIRTWGWLAFLRAADGLCWGNALGSGPHAPWFVPGSAYGSTEPVLQTVQLKWARAAEQDNELLRLVPDQELARRVAQVIVKPVSCAGALTPSDVLWCGTSDRSAWATAGQVIDVGATTMPTSTWAIENRRPRARIVGIQFLPTSTPDRLTANVEVEDFHASPSASTDVLTWDAVPPGWTGSQTPTPVNFRPAGANLARAAMSASVSLTGIMPEHPTAFELLLASESTLAPVPCRCVVPVASSLRRDRPVELDGSLAEWSATDALLLDQPLVRLWDRPSLQRGAPEPAQTASSLYSAWDDQSLYLAFRLEGVNAASLGSTRNFVHYDQGQAWGEDLAEILIQPIGADGKSGPLLHVVCKPGGSWVERASDRASWSTWSEASEFASGGIRYASTLDSGRHVWRGEVAIPWSTLTSGAARPGLLRFNFAQHRQDTGETATWAGPTDGGRDPSIMGLVVLREPDSTAH